MCDNKIENLTSRIKKNFLCLHQAKSYDKINSKEFLQPDLVMLNQKKHLKLRDSKNFVRFDSAIRNEEKLLKRENFLDLFRHLNVIHFLNYPKDVEPVINFQYIPKILNTNISPCEIEKYIEEREKNHIHMKEHIVNLKMSAPSGEYRNFIRYLNKTSDTSHHNNQNSNPSPLNYENPLRISQHGSLSLIFIIFFLLIAFVNGFLISTNGRLLTVINQKMILSFTGTDIDLERHGGREFKIKYSGLELDQNMRMVRTGEHFRLVSTGEGILDKHSYESHGAGFADVDNYRRNGDRAYNNHDDNFDESYDRGNLEDYSDGPQNYDTDDYREKLFKYHSKNLEEYYSDDHERHNHDQLGNKSNREYTDPLLMYSLAKSKKYLCAFKQPFLSFYILKRQKCLQANGSELVLVHARDIEREQKEYITDHSSLKNFDGDLASCSRFEILPYNCENMNFNRMFKSSIFIRPLSDNLRSLKQTVEMVDEKGIKGLEDEKWQRLVSE